MTTDHLIALIKSNFEALELLDNNTLLIPKENLEALALFLHQTEGLYFDHLACITGLDNSPKEKSYEVVYNFYSIPYEHSMSVKVKIYSDQEEIPSLTSIWKGANWLEREVFDLYGIRFSNHPDLRRILLPANWVGYPMRKDYKTQEFFHGIKVDY